MRVLTVYAHPDRKSFCHAVLEQFTGGLREAGHEVDIVDLYAIKFDPVFRTRDMASYLHEDMPPDILESMNLKQRVLDNAPGGPVGRAIASRWLRDKSTREVAKLIREHAPKDAREQWRRVDAAEGLAFIAPVFWLHFPAILKGWFERVFAYGSAYALTREGWEGHASGRVPLMHHDKALIISPTLFCEADYKADWEQPMRRIIDDWGLRYPGVEHVEHVYFYGAAIADPAQIQDYLRRARQLGREFAAAPRTPALAGASAQQRASDHAG
jgi:NAD(P)H dehydrogenase (quinone)